MTQTISTNEAPSHLTEEAEKNYQAPAPESVPVSLPRRFFAFLLKPVQFIMNMLFGRLLAFAILPVAHIDSRIQETREEHNNWFNPKNNYLGKTRLAVETKRYSLTYNLLNVTTHDDAILETLELKQPHHIPAETNHIIYFTGNGSCYEDIINTMLADAKEFTCNAIGFNLRGVVNSTGSASSETHLLTDSIAQVQRLLDKGIPPEKIILKGHSLGGVLATLTAAHFKKLGIEVKLFNDRSLSSVTNFVISFFFPESKHLNWIQKGIIWGIKAIVYPFVSLSGWELDAGSAYKTITDDNKDYILIRPNEEKRKEIKNYNYGSSIDCVVRQYASIHYSEKPERTKQKAQINARTKEAVLHHTPNATPEEISAAQKEARAHLKTRKMQNFSSTVAHGAHPSNLRNPQNETAQQYFARFFNRVTQKQDMPINPGHISPRPLNLKG